jgi:peptide deformylase
LKKGAFQFLDLREEIIRPDKIELKWQDLSGELRQETPDGLLTICIQHEIDHLEGKLMVDYISPIKRDRIRKKLSK